MNENQKSLVVTGIVILSMAACVAALTRPRGRSGARPAPAAQQGIATKAPASAEAAAGDESVDRRAGFASQLERRLRAQGKGITVRATGLGGRVLEFNWTVQADREHMENLKKARPLHDQMKDLGFTNLELKVKERKVWSREI